MISLGSILVDVAVEVPRLPERGADVLATATRTQVGGGFNLAAAAARHGARCVYGSPHGTGLHGDLVRAALAEEGIEAAGGRRDGGDTGFCLIMVEPDGERTFVTMPGVEACLTPGDLATLRPGPADFVAVSGYDLAYPVSGPVLAAWLTGLPPYARVALDPGPLVAEIPADRLRAALGRLSVLTLNQREARLLATPARPDETDGATETGGTSGTGRADGAGAGVDRLSGAALVEAVRRHPALAADAVVVVREGALGCHAGGGPLGDRIIAVPAPRVKAVDTTGAGDAHTGVLLAELVSGTALDEALVAANRAAAVAVTLPGSATAPRRPPSP
ncbi:sugar kinase [Microtetraspora sp. NBRC 13810]|nr:sugar kinase [Microtetraspora sp. NBRC 13810]